MLGMYKISLLLSLTVFILILALRVERDPLNIIMAFVGSLVGAVLLDLDYFLHAYFLEPEKDFSKTLNGFVKHRNIGGALSYIHYHKDEIKDKTLNSMLFQVILGGLVLFVVPSNSTVLMKAVVLSTFVNSIYRMIEVYFEGDINEWFWALKTPPSRNGFYIYTAVLAAMLLLGLYFL